MDCFTEKIAVVSGTTSGIVFALTWWYRLFPDPIGQRINRVAV